MASIKNMDIKNGINYCIENEIFEEINNIYSTIKGGECSGCGDCCNESVGINLVEFLNIYYFLDRDRELKVKSTDKILEYYFSEYITKKSCPFKDENNRCNIYEVRPLNCRIYGNWEKKDYELNLANIKDKNSEFAEIMKSELNVSIPNEIINYEIKYCEKFKPYQSYMKKTDRMDLADNMFILDSKILANEIMALDYKDRGIVEYFIETLLEEELAFKIKVEIAKKKKLKIINRLKKITNISNK